MSKNWQTGSFENHVLEVAIPPDLPTEWQRLFGSNQYRLELRAVRSRVALTTAISTKDHVRRVQDCSRLTLFDLRGEDASELPPGPETLRFSTAWQDMLMGRQMENMRWASKTRYDTEELAHNLADQTPLEDEVHRLIHVDGEALRALPPVAAFVTTQDKKTTKKLPDSLSTELHQRFARRAFLPLRPPKEGGKNWVICKEEPEEIQGLLLRDWQGYLRTWKATLDVRELAPERLRSLWTVDAMDHAATPFRSGEKRQKH